MDRIRQAPLSMDFPGKDTGVGWHVLLQEIFPAQGLNSHLLHWQMYSLPLSHHGSPMEYNSAIKKNEIMLFAVT